MPYTTQDNIISKNLYRDSLHLNLVGFYILAEDFSPYILKNWLQIETQKQRKSIEVSSSENTTENSDKIIDDLKILRLKYTKNAVIAQININFIQNTFEPLVSLATPDIGVLMISKTKIHESFLLSQFMIDEFSISNRCDLIMVVI